MFAKENQIIITYSTGRRQSGWTMKEKKQLKKNKIVRNRNCFGFNKYVGESALSHVNSSLPQFSSFTFSVVAAKRSYTHSSLRFFPTNLVEVVDDDASIGIVISSRPNKQPLTRLLADFWNLRLYRLANRIMFIFGDRILVYYKTRICWRSRFDAKFLLCGHIVMFTTVLLI